jgi:hypothetical protein
MLLAIYSIMWEQRTLADRDRPCEPEWARSASTNYSAAEVRQPKEGPQPEKTPLKGLGSALRHAQGWEAS